MFINVRLCVIVWGNCSLSRIVYERGISFHFSTMDIAPLIYIYCPFSFIHDSRCVLALDPDEVSRKGQRITRW